MPRMDGFEVLTRLRTEPAAAGMRVVMLSGRPADNLPYPAIGRAEEFYQAPESGSLGFDLMVMKDSLKDPADLIRTLETICPPV